MCERVSVAGSKHQMGDREQQLRRGVDALRGELQRMAGRQARRQAGRQAGRQTGRQEGKGGQENEVWYGHK